MPRLCSSRSRTAELRKIAKFSLVGFMTVAVYFAILFAVAPLIRSTAALAAIAYLGSAIFNYALQRNFTFQARLAHSTSLRRYVVMHGLMLTTNSGLMFLLVEGAAVNLYLAQLPVTAIIAAIGFLLSRLWVYADR